MATIRPARCPGCSRRRTPPTAAFVASDYIALGMLSAAETHGVRVPEDLSVVGFDDIRLASTSGRG